MKRMMFCLTVPAVIIQVCACIAMGLEIFVATHLNPDMIIMESCLMGVCLIVEIVSAFYRIYPGRRGNSSGNTFLKREIKNKEGHDVS